MNKNSIVRRQVNALNDLKLFELKDKFREVYGFEPGYTTATKLRRRIAYRLQRVNSNFLNSGVGKMDKKELPENIRQAIDLIAAVIRRIHEKRLDNDQNESLYIPNGKGVAI